MSDYKVVDLFCGCGGLTRGLELTGRFRTVLGVDNADQPLTTFKANHGRGTPPTTWLGDIRDLVAGELWAILRDRGISRPGDLDCLVGGPPCEGFSRNRVYSGSAGMHSEDRDDRKQYREKKYWQSAWAAEPGVSTLEGATTRRIRAYQPFLDDPRNFLFREFLGLVEMLAPKVVVIENVRQILSHRDGEIATEILERLTEMNYTADARMLRAADYGVPQLRERAFFIGVRNDLSRSNALPWPTSTHSPVEEPLPPEGLPGDEGFHVTVLEAIGDLPASRGQRSVQGTSRGPLKEYPDVALTTFRRLMRSESGTPANHIHRMPSESVLRRMRAMRPGMKPHELPAELQVRKYYYNAYGRLEWNKPANTITKSFLYPGSGKFGHPVEDRVISYREAARLQSFDDDFTFFARSQEGLAHMIGSAVPPLLGRALGEAIAQLLDESAAAGSDEGEASAAADLELTMRRAAGF